MCTTTIPASPVLGKMAMSILNRCIDGEGTIRFKEAASALSRAVPAMVESLSFLARHLRLAPANEGFDGSSDSSSSGSSTRSGVGMGGLTFYHPWSLPLLDAPVFDNALERLSKDSEYVSSFVETLEAEVFSSLPPASYPSAALEAMGYTQERYNLTLGLVRCIASAPYLNESFSPSAQGDGNKETRSTLLEINKLDVSDNQCSLSKVLPNGIDSQANLGSRGAMEKCFSVITVAGTTDFVQDALALCASFFVLQLFPDVFFFVTRNGGSRNKKQAHRRRKLLLS